MTAVLVICGWCPDAIEQTASARAHGFEVSHGLCKACAATLHAGLDAVEASDRAAAYAERLREAVDL